ncbi:N(4)-(Beta-N-acetylglucosaminyl)-L-asparaginase precursor [Phycisphaerae bacterium RAS1]|nr:N(4)-(Beta-N-acetylglucosaminyl)-L-asparaginase precursor [Phycisphaerae bacterium RAS1]
MRTSRREFIQTAAGAAALGLPAAACAQDSSAPPTAAAREFAPPRSPIIVGSANGLKSGPLALQMVREGGDPLDAVIAAINVVEDDPSDHSVGYGGLPNEEGVVELDASVMHGPTHRAGGVAALQRIRYASKVARLVAQRTNHVLLVGEGALRFARAHGFKEENLLTDEAREIWLKWKESMSDKDDWLAPASQPSGKKNASAEILYTHGTINMLALTPSGDLAGCTSTSGLSYKIPGRVGDSPIIGAGLYVDNAVGAAGSTGRGESNLQNCSSFLIVELMRQGMDPQSAALEALRRIAARCEKHLRNEKGEPTFDVQFYALRRDGKLGGAAMRKGGRLAVHDEQGSRIVETPGLFT